MSTSDDPRAAATVNGVNGTIGKCHCFGIPIDDLLAHVENGHLVIGVPSLPIAAADAGIDPRLFEISRSGLVQRLAAIATSSPSGVVTNLGHDPSTHDLRKPIQVTPASLEIACHKSR